MRQIYWRITQRGKIGIGLLLAVLVLFGLHQQNKVSQGVYLDYAEDIPIMTDILPEDYKGRSGIKRQIRYVVIHETANRDVGSNASAHNEFLHSSVQKEVQLSWHYTVDDKEIYHHLPDDEIAWHAGDRLKRKGGNVCGIGVEICVNEDGDYAKAVQNAAKLTANLLNVYELDLNDVKQHYDFSGKNCPQRIRKEETWQEFLNQVEEYWLQE